MILVVGATGFLGTEICRRLTATGKTVRAMVRSTADPAKVNNLKSLGITTILGDLKDRTSLDAACKGKTTIISTASACPTAPAGDSIPTTDLDGQISLVDAAKAAGISHFIYISYSGHVSTDCPLISAKRSVEQHLKKSGIAYTILRPSYFMEDWLSPALGFDFPNAKAQIYGLGQNKISWISLGDVAQFAVDSVDNPGARNMTLELGGPEALSPLETVRVFERVLGKRFKVQHVAEESLRTQRAQATEPLSQSFAGLMIDYARGDAIDMKAALQAFPLKLTSVEDYARRQLAGSGA